VILWNIEKETPEKIYDLRDSPTCISFHPEIDNIFVTGSLDQTLMTWDIESTEKCLDEIYTNDSITALAYQPNGKNLIVGLSTGTCNVYTCDTVGKLKWSTKMDCKNRKGKFALGRKICGIIFINTKDLIITTNDSRMRLYNIDEFIHKVKFKGFKGESLQLKSSVSRDGQRITQGSEDGNIFIWDVNKIGPNAYKDAKCKGYEFFNPFLLSQ
jgi:WD repeat-containing protein 44